MAKPKPHKGARNIAVVLLSGGLDSTVTLAHAVKLLGAENVTALNIHYGQRHAKEIDCAKAVAKALGVNYVEKNIQGVIGVGGLTDSSLVIPKVSYAELGQGVSPTYVPFRNGLLLSIAASLASAMVAPKGRDSGLPAEEQINLCYLMYGAHAEDAENDAYPDCSVAFVRAMDAAIQIGTYQQVNLLAPFAYDTKAKVVSIGHAMKAPMHLSWSCYEGGDLHCGICPTCRARKAAFDIAEVEDPTSYHDDL